MVNGRVRLGAMMLAMVVAALPTAALANEAIEPIVGGGDFETAVPLDVGTYADTVTLNEATFYQLTPSAGMAVTAEVVVDAVDEDVDGRLQVTLLDDARQHVDGPATTTLDAAAAPVDLRGSFPDRGGAPATGYLVVSAAGRDPQADDTVDIHVAIATTPNDPADDDAAPAAAVRADVLPADRQRASRAEVVVPGTTNAFDPTLPIVLGLLAGAVIGALRAWYTAPPA